MISGVTAVLVVAEGSGGVSLHAETPVREREGNGLADELRAGRR